MAALKLITSGVSFFSHALMAARKRDDVQSYTDASHFTEEMSCQLLPQRGSCDDLRLALGARAFPPGPKRLWIIIVNIIIIIIIVGWALRACVILRGLGWALGPSAKATSKDYHALCT